MNSIFIGAGKLIVLGVVLTYLSGCVGAATGQPMTAEMLNSEALFYVARQPKDDRQLHENIASGLKARGYEAVSGEEGEAPEDAAYVVTYIDRWQWDMRMYLSDLRIEVRDVKDNSLLGYGQSAQSSLKAMGTTHDDVIERALAQLFGS